ncbi:putative kinase [Friedmanniella endophytica]|uniref:Putative kinase n=1 Tax=Microlunatus kandeliicorticis TaxID=1759536 RepID=A0A7W3P6B2_9ACTN|nr:AAA family ATPase [Microlunatus kandeliicorticis]MBA8794866.1 putative kinase [Microlunatus kandeliicorticis]
MLIVMAGLPGAGKSRLADDLGAALGWPVLSVDPVESAMWAVGIDRDQPTGIAAYVVVEVLAEHQLRLGSGVVVDAVNDVPEARAQWTGLADRTGAALAWVEVFCSDADVHRQRLESRRRDLPVAMEPSWDSLPARAERLAAWTAPRIRVDSLDDPAANLAGVLSALGRTAG